MTKHGPTYLRWALLEATMHALRHPAYAARYQRTKKRLGKQRGAKIAQVDIARRLAHAIWHMLTRPEPRDNGGGVGSRPPDRPTEPVKRRCGSLVARCYWRVDHAISQVALSGLMWDTARAAGRVPKHRKPHGKEVQVGQDEVEAIALLVVALNEVRAGLRDDSLLAPILDEAARQLRACLPRPLAVPATRVSA